jgi:hypothetical protein
MGVENEGAIRSAEAFQERLSRSVPISAAVFAVYVVMAALSWRRGGSGRHWPFDAVTILGFSAAVVTLVLLAYIFTGMRERVLLLLPALRILVALIAGSFPSALEPAKHAIKIGSHVLWSIGVLVSFTFVVNATQHDRRRAHQA